jgi:hypothetical protein
MEMSLLFAFVLTVILWSGLFKAALQVHSFRPNKWSRLFVVILPMLCVLFIAAVVWKLGSPDVRSSPEWILFYTICGAAWLQLGLSALAFLGINTRTDVLERQNTAATWVVCGSLMGTAFCYAGGNIGEGPGPEAVFCCAALSTLSLFLSWFCIDRIFRLGDRITIERDADAGVRTAGWLSGLGLLLGDSVAGKWKSFEDTLHDFAHSSRLVLFFLLAAAAIELIFGFLRKRERTWRMQSVAVAIAYLAAAAIYVASRGVR